MSNEHVEVLRNLSEVCRAAIKAGDWKVDGACDPDAVLRRADSAIAALSAPQPPAEAQAVAWSAVKPGRPGVYGVRGFNLCREPEEQFEAVVSVRLYEGDLICNLHEYTSEEDFDRWIRVEDCSDGFEWREFVPAHPPPSAPVGVEDVDALAQEIRRVDGDHSLGASALAEALVTYLARTTIAQQPAAAPVGVEGLIADWRDQARRLRNEVPNLRDGTDKRFLAACDADRAADELEAALAQQPAAVDEAWLSKARELYDRCKLWPENSSDGFMALLDLRNHVGAALAGQQGDRND